MTKMVRSCSDSYYFQLVFEYLIHMNLSETATTFKRECGLKRYNLKFNEELCSSSAPTFNVPKIVLYLPTTLHADEYSSPESVSKQSSNCNCFSHEDTHDIILIKPHKWEEKIGKSTNTQKESQQKLSRIENSDFMGSYDNLSFFVKRHNENALLSSQPKQNIFLRSESITAKSDPNKEHNLNYTQLKTKFSKLHSDYHNLIGVASELTAALEMSARGQQIDLRQTLNNCVQIYPELFLYDINAKDISKKDIKGRFSVRSTNCEWRLHIPLIKRHLQEGNVKTRLLLLQALRWAITKSSSQKRECIMSQYVWWDLLNLKKGSLLKSLLAPLGVVTPHPLQQSVARLLNTVASVQSGRNYLAQNSQTVNVTAAVLQQLDGISSDSTTQNMLLAALQKLSLRRNQRVAMIQAGMVEWLFQQFSNHDKESLYSVEYGTALLMNLCLHQSARELCIPMAQNVLTVLIRLLSTPVTQALAYINGTLYSLITHPKLNDAALAIGLQEALEYNIKKQTNAEIRKQMQHILEFHKSLPRCSNFSTASFTISEGEMIDEDDEDLELLGDELDESDPVRNINGELSGENLLEACYTLPENNGETTQSESEPSEGSTSLMFGPSTPQHLRQNILQHITEQVGNDMNTEITEVHNVSIKNNWHCRKLRTGNQQKNHEMPNQHSLSGSDTSEAPQEYEGEIMSSKEVLWNDKKITEPTFNLTNELLNLPSDVSKITVPEISIHLVDSKENSINTSDVDEDSEDVQVASTGLHKEQSGDEFSSNTLKGGTASAFTSRPKIPRTPPQS